MNTRLFSVALASTIACVAATPACARDDQARLAFKLPAQSLGTSLNEVAQRFGRNVAASAEVLAGRSAPALDGDFTFQEAVRALLRGSGLRAVEAGSGVVIQPGAPMSAPATSADEPAGKAIVVTGTRIRGAQPAGERVLVVDRAEIDRSGYATTQQVLQSLPQNFGGGLNEATVGFTIRNNANANVGFGSSVNLRGLGATSTLTLVDGKRVALGGVSGMFVDLSLIPTSAIDRIEVLADGASAIYGSDAVAGVVNVRLRDDFHGAETRLRYGAADGFSEVQASQLAGVRWSSGHLTLGYEFYRRGNLAASARPYATEDLTAYGGPDYRKTFANPGTIIAANGEVFGIPAGQDGTSLTAADLLAGTANYADGRANSDILPHVERHAAFGVLTQELTSWLTFKAEGFYADRRTARRSYPDNYGNVVVPVTNPFYVDPIGTDQPVTVNYSFEKDLGIETQLVTVRAFSAVAGIEAHLGAWRADLGGTYSEQRERDWTINIPNYYWLAQALADTDPATAYNVFGDGSNTAQSTIDKVRGYYASNGISTVKSGTLKFDGPLFALPGGSAKLAFGAEVRGERYDADSMSYDFYAVPTDVGSAGFPMSRTVAAAFAELSLPLVAGTGRLTGKSALDLSLAGRFEHYSDFGATANPRIGVTWHPSGAVALRASYGRSFRAPSFVDIRQGKGTNQYVPLTEADPASPTGTSNVLALFGANPDVGPERASTWTFGASIAPERVPGLKLDLSYFDVAYRDRIGTVGNDYLSFLSNRSYYQALIIDNPSAETIAAYYNDQNFRNYYGIAANDITAIIDGRTQNLSRVDLNGIDFDLGYTWKTGRTTFAVGASGSWIFHIRQKITPGAPVTDIVSTIGNPVDIRARGRLVVTRGALGAAGFVNFTDGYANNAVTPTERVSSWMTVDAQVSYDLSAWLAGTRLALSASNLFDRAPPYVNNATAYSAAGFDPSNASAVGRMVSIQLVKSW